MWRLCLQRDTEKTDNDAEQVRSELRARQQAMAPAMETLIRGKTPYGGAAGGEERGCAHGAWVWGWPARGGPKATAGRAERRQAEKTDRDLGSGQQHR